MALAVLASDPDSMSAGLKLILHQAPGVLKGLWALSRVGLVVHQWPNENRVDDVKLNMQDGLVRQHCAGGQY